MPQLLGKAGLGWGMTIIAGILVIVAIWTLIGIKNTPEEAGEYPDGDPTYAVNGAEIAKMMREYKSPFKFSVLAKDSSTWLIAFGSGFAFMAVMSYIASAIPTMMSYGYDYPFATTIFAVGGICGICGSFLFGLIDQSYSDVVFIFQSIRPEEVDVVFLYTVIITELSFGLHEIDIPLCKARVL